MKRYIIVCCCLFALVGAFAYAYLFNGFYLPFHQEENDPVEVVAR